MADTHYDVIVIGSGAGGGTLAYRHRPVKHEPRLQGYSTASSPRAQGWTSLVIRCFEQVAPSRSK
jgi:hypothetical protein